MKIVISISILIIALSIGYWFIGRPIQLKQCVGNAINNYATAWNQKCTTDGIDNKGNDNKKSECFLYPSSRQPLDDELKREIDICKVTLS